MASFNGVDLGICYIQTEANPSERQVNAYPGVNGLEILTMGSRGWKSHAQGTLFATSAAGLILLESAFRNLEANETVSLLVDTLGVVWANVRIDHYRPTGDAFPVGIGGVGRSYEMTFLHSS